jgi:hypothetical protein
MVSLRTYVESYPDDVAYPFHFANFHSSCFDCAAVYIAAVVVAVTAEYPLVNVSTPNASDHDVVVACAWASPVPFHGEEGALIPLTPYAFAALVVVLSAWVGAFVEVQIGAVNEAEDETNILAEVRNYPAAPEIAKAFPSHGMVEVVQSFLRCEVDDCKQDYSWGALQAFQQEKDSLEQRVLEA